MAMIQHPCALSHYEVDLPPLPYSVKLGFNCLQRELKESGAGEILSRYTLEGSNPEEVELSTPECENLKWSLTPWMPLQEPFDRMMAISLPFTFDVIYSHPGFSARFIDPETSEIKAHAFVAPEVMQRERVLYAIRHILKRVYGEKVTIPPQAVFIHHNSELNLPEFYTFSFDVRFIEVEVLGGDPPKLDRERLNGLLYNPSSTLKEWLEIIPVDAFAFKGFSMISATDVTTKEALAGFHRELQQGTIIDKDRLNNLQQYFRIFTRAPEMTLKIYIPRKEKVLLIEPNIDGNPGCMLSNSVSIPKEKVESTRFYKVLDGDDQVWCESDEQLSKMVLPETEETVNEECLWVPLKEGGEAIGLLELTFHERETLLQSNPFVFSEMVSAITQALRRSVSDLQQRIQSVIQTNCTALHSSVVWRFEDEARKYMERSASANFSEIVFNNVYPLYSQSDIQSSSAFRNEAIRSDLNHQLTLAADALMAMNEDQSMPLYGEMLFRIEERKERLKGELQSSDELSIQQFLKSDIESILNEFSDSECPSYRAIQTYLENLDPKYGMVHQERGRYERAVNQINQWIMAEIDKEQVSAQAMIPHYSEKTSTDGVELSLYLGESILQNGAWSELHLRNLRLWQLILTCRISRHCEEILPELDLPLRMTHLILVQDMPLTIRFSTEEKEFTVDGAYNIRYEIMKKRIDKATVVGRKGERLTQPGMVAVVYSHNSEADMYRGFFDYLQSMSIIGPEVEDYELEALQGLTGLRALRVQVLPDRREVSRGPEPDIASDLL
jgi:hypothetical protein